MDMQREMEESKPAAKGKDEKFDMNMLLEASNPLARNH